MLWPRLDDGKEPLKHLDLALELAVSLSELSNLVLERGDLGLCSLRAGLKMLGAGRQSREPIIWPRWTFYIDLRPSARVTSPWTMTRSFVP